MRYEERLREVNLTILEGRTRIDMITIYKILRGTDRADRDRLLELRGPGSRGHR